MGVISLELPAVGSRQCCVRHHGSALKGRKHDEAKPVIRACRQQGDSSRVNLSFSRSRNAVVKTGKNDSGVILTPPESFGRHSVMRVSVIEKAGWSH